MNQTEVFFVLAATVGGQAVQVSGVVTAGTREAVYEYALDKIREAVGGATITVTCFAADPNQL